MGDARISGRKLSVDLVCLPVTDRPMACGDCARAGASLSPTATLLRKATWDSSSWLA
jgi:hypothetical protein